MSLGTADWSLRRRLGNNVRQVLARFALRARAERGAAMKFPGELRSRRLAFAKLDGIGDLILSTTVLRPFHDAGVCEDVTLFCRAPGAALAAGQFPGWRVVELPPLGKPVRSMFLDRALRRRLRDHEVFDLLVDLRAGRDLGDSVFVSWIPARYKVAFENQVEIDDIRLRDESPVYDRLLPKPIRDDESVPQEIANFRELARLIHPEGGDTSSLLPRLLSVPGTAGQVREVLTNEFRLRPDERFLLVCPGSLHVIKEYPPERLAAALGPVLRKSRITTLLGGSRNDSRIAASLEQALLEMGGRIINLSGRFDLIQHLALVSLAAAVVSMDSSTAHIAGALGRPAVVLLGGGHPGRFGPWGESATFQWLTQRTDCYGCSWICSQPYPRCIQDIPESVITGAVLEVLAQGTAFRQIRCPNPRLAD